MTLTDRQSLELVRERTMSIQKRCLAGSSRRRVHVQKLKDIKLKASCPLDNVAIIRDCLGSDFSAKVRVNSVVSKEELDAICLFFGNNFHGDVPSRWTTQINFYEKNCTVLRLSQWCSIFVGFCFLIAKLNHIAQNKRTLFRDVEAPSDHLIKSSCKLNTMMEL